MLLRNASYHATFVRVVVSYEGFVNLKRDWYLISEKPAR